MFIHYLKTALRSFTAHRLHSAINVLGLILGLVCFLAAYIFVDYVRRTDAHFEDSDRIYSIFQRTEIRQLGLDLPFMSYSSSRISEQLRADMPELKGAARSTDTRERLVSVDHDGSYRRVRHVEPDFLEIFDLPYLEGSNELSLGQERSAVLTEATALALFGSTNTIGRLLELSDGRPVSVVGVISEIPEPSHLGQSLLSQGFEVLIVTSDPTETSRPEADYFGEATAWLDPSTFTYVRLPADGSLMLERLNGYLQSLPERFIDEADGVIELEARPISNIGIESLDELLWGEYPISVGGIIFLLGAGVLGIACLNFINLSTGTATARFKEIAMRKVVGASGGQVAGQYLFEALLAVLVALIIARPLSA